LHITFTNRKHSFCSKKS